MAKSAQLRCEPLDKLAILHGAREVAELGYRKELREIFQDNPNLYLPTISRPHLSPEWQGHRGRVETLFDENKLAQLEAHLGLEPGGLNPANVVIYICGLFGTIHGTIQRLLRRGFIPSDRTLRKALHLLDEPPSLFFEQYDDTPILDVSNTLELKLLLADTPFAGRVQ
jgi:NAD(P)H-flavin reductase